MYKPHKKLEVWKKSMQFVTDVYRTTATLPEDEKYGLISQIRRSATSIPSNIAEGAARKSKSEFMQFVHIAMGSCSELDTQLEICQRLGYLKQEVFDSLDSQVNEIDLMLVGLRNSLKKSIENKKGEAVSS